MTVCLSRDTIADMVKKNNSSEENSALKSTRNRSASYPAIDLQEAILYIEKIKKALSTAPFNRTTGAKAMGCTGATAASATKMAALAYFGLLQR